MTATNIQSELSIFSVDVEDWFHILEIPGLPDYAQWASLPSRVCGNFMRLLDIFDEHSVQVTCFFLGWVAERFPVLVREAAQRGHEIASHGFSHTLVYEQTRAEFSADVTQAKNVLEQITGATVAGYRCPGFSVTEQSPWFFDVLAETGYTYDSSVFPAVRQFGGLPGANVAPHSISGTKAPLLEFPISVAPILGRNICFFGGGYLRLFPYWMIRRMGKRVLADRRPVVFYIHPREIDVGHPRLPMRRGRRFRSYVNLETTEPKIRQILRDFRVTSYANYIQQTGLRANKIS
jgi:polysaccharide deacetylase family protein (PEP-CTERM system associated)